MRVRAGKSDPGLLSAAEVAAAVGVQLAEAPEAAQAEQIHAYIVKRAELTRHARLEPHWWTGVKEFVYPKIAPLLNWLQQRKFS